MLSSLIKDAIEKNIDNSGLSVAAASDQLREATKYQVRKIGF